MTTDAPSVCQDQESTRGPANGRGWHNAPALCRKTAIARRIDGPLKIWGTAARIAGKSEALQQRSARCTHQLRIDRVTEST